MKPIIRRHHKKLWLTVILFLTTLFGWYFSQAPVFRTTEESALDFFFKLRMKPVSEKVPETVIVMIDEASLEKDYGYYDPLPRRYLARVIDTLSAKGAKVIAVDIAFYEKMTKLDPGGDTALVEAMKRANNVIAVSIWHDQEEGVFYQEPDSFFIDGLRGTGYANLQISGGGMLARVREVKPIVDIGDGRTVLSFSSLAYCMYKGIEPDAFIRDIENRENVILKDLPLYHRGNMYINFDGPPARWRKEANNDWIQIEEGAMLTYRSSRLTGEVAWPEQFFKDKVVFIGNGSEFVPDRFVTPYFSENLGNWMYGAEVHANAFLTMLRQDFISKTPAWMVLLLLVFLVFIVIQITVHYGFLTEIGSVIALILITWIAGYLLFANYHLWLPVMSMSMAVLIAYFGTSVYQAFTEERNKKQIKSMFARYAPPSYVDELSKDPTKLELGGEEKEISILFSDIEGFTTISETLSPKQLIELLNEYLGAMTNAIFHQGGTLDKYIGDAIVAVFGAPLSLEKHAIKACQAAVEMRKTLDQIRDGWIQRGFPSVKARIGLNTGRVVFGNIGSDIRYDYTGIGDAMNLSSRLEGANKQYGTYCMISEFTFEQTKDDIIVRDLDVIIVKGKSKPVKVYELIGMKDEPLDENRRQMLAHYQKGIELYRNRQWREAIQCFEKALESVPDDCPSQLYIKRCREFIQIPPEQEWDGTYHMSSK